MSADLNCFEHLPSTKICELKVEYLINEAANFKMKARISSQPPKLFFKVTYCLKNF